MGPSHARRYNLTLHTSRAHTKLFYICFAFLSLAVGPVSAQQQVTILWASKQPQSGPITVDQNTPVHIVVIGVNDALYHYEGYLTAEPTPPPNIQFPAAPLAPAIAAACSDVTNTLKTIATNMKSWQLNPWVDEKGKDLSNSTPNSVSLETTRQFYLQNISGKFAGISQAQAQNCNLDAQWSDINSFIQDWTERLGRPHTYAIDTTLAPLNNYTIHLIEYAVDANHPQQMTNACSQNGKASECTIKYEPQTNLLSASGGFLFSELQSRTYTRANVPGMTDAVLQVNGNGKINASLLTALVNVKIPCFWPSQPKIPPCSPNSDSWGWMFSVGPAFQLGSNNQTTRVGLFAGVSLHFWKYMYLTPGLHVGDFADFPPGFTHSGQDIPSSFTGALTPQTRPTARFAVAITFKGFNIPTGSSKSSGQTTTQNNTK
jgi:hypothetical protein